MSFSFAGNTWEGVYKLISDTGSEREKEIISYPPADGVAIKSYGKTGRILNYDMLMIKTSKSDLENEKTKWFDLRDDVTVGSLSSAFVNISNCVIMAISQNGSIYKSADGRYFASFSLSILQLSE